MSISFTKKVNTEFLKAINEFNMLGKGENTVSSVLVGYSGGADSSVLLRLLKNLSDEQDSGLKIYAVHINHMIRGKEADEDCDFCEKTAKELGVEFISRKIDVPSISENEGIGLEEAARNVRYSVFAEIAEEYGISAIATAHNSSDNLETVLFNLTRGTGINGLCGIPPIRGNIIRPLIYCSKPDIMGYCEENGIPFVTDSTNTDTTYSRNYIRNVIIPEILQLNSEAETAVNRMCSLLRKDKAFLDGAAAEYQLPQKLDVLESLDEVILGRVLHKAYSEAGATEPLGFDRTSEITAQIKLGEDTRMSLHGKIDFVIYKNRAFFEKHEKNEKAEYKYFLSEGENLISEDGSVIFLSKNEELSDDEKNIIKSLKNIYKLSIHNIFYFDKITEVAFARSRNEGDKIRSCNMTKSVKKMLQSSGLEPSARRTVPFICDEEGILWIPGVAKSDRINSKNCKEIWNLWYFKGKKDIK